MHTVPGFGAAPQLRGGRWWHRAAATFGIVLATLCWLGAARAVRADEDGEMQVSRVSLSVTEGVDRSNNRTFSIQADHAEIGELLRTVFRKINADVVIDQDVAGPVSLSVHDVPFRDALQWIVQAARPQIKITRSGSIYHVQRDLLTQQQVDALQARIQALTGGGLAGLPSAGQMLPQPHPLASPIQLSGVPNRYVSLDVPASKPIPLADAVARISAQTRFSILLDPSVPQQLTFTGTITQAPLSLVLTEIAQTSGLKVVGNPTQATFYPTDQFTLRVNTTLFNEFPGAPCPKCGAWVAASWNFCPNCGQITPRGRAQMKQDSSGKKPE